MDQIAEELFSIDVALRVLDGVVGDAASAVVEEAITAVDEVTCSTKLPPGKVIDLTGTDVSEVDVSIVDELVYVDEVSAEDMGVGDTVGVDTALSSRDEEVVDCAEALEDATAAFSDVPKLLVAVVELPLETPTSLTITTSPFALVILTSTVVPKPDEFSKKL